MCVCVYVCVCVFTCAYIYVQTHPVDKHVDIGSCKDICTDSKS